MHTHNTNITQKKKGIIVYLKLQQRVIGRKRRLLQPGQKKKGTKRKKGAC
jgi:hypothetical protein